MKCACILILLFFSLQAQTTRRSIRYLDLDSIVQKEIYEYSENLSSKLNTSHGYMRVVLHVNDTGAIDSVSVVENKLNNPYPVINELRTWKLHSIPDTLLPIAVEYFLNVNHRFNNNTDEESNRKKMITWSNFYFPHGYGFNFSVFSFPKYTGSLFRLGMILEAEILTIKDDSTGAGVIFGAGGAVAFLAGNDVNPFSFLFDFKIPFGFAGKIIIAVESDQLLLLRIGGGFKVVASAGLFERIYFSTDGLALLAGPRLSAGIEF